MPTIYLSVELDNHISASPIKVINISYITFKLVLWLTFLIRLGYTWTKWFPWTCPIATIRWWVKLLGAWVLKGKILNDCVMDNETKMTLYRLAITYPMSGIVIHLFAPACKYKWQTKLNEEMQSTNEMVLVVDTIDMWSTRSCLLYTSDAADE